MGEREESQKLHAAIQDGTLTPSEGEARAKELGIGALNEDPEMTRFHPFSLDWWSLEMAVAWIAERTVEAVVLHWDQYTNRCRRWKKDNVGHLLVSVLPASLAMMLIDSSAYKQHWYDLRLLLKRGDVASRGLSKSAHDQVAIDPLHWEFLTPSLDGNFATIYSSLQPYLGYQNIIVRQKDITRNWPRRLTAAELDAEPIEESDGTYLLFDAVCHFARNDPDGRPQAIALEDAIARLLSLLYDQKLGATGLNRFSIRENIPNVVWEMASWEHSHIDPNRHRVGFAEPEGSKFHRLRLGGTLTLHSLEKDKDKNPDWISIKLNAAEVRALCEQTDARPPDLPEPTELVLEQSSLSIKDRVKAAGGIAALSKGEQTIYHAIQTLGGESKLLPPSLERAERIQEHCKTKVPPSRRTIDKFFKKFPPAVTE